MCQDHPNISAQVSYICCPASKQLFQILSREDAVIKEANASWIGTHLMFV